MIATTASASADRFRLVLPFRLQRPAMLARPTGSASFVPTFTYIPGAALLGMLATRWKQAERSDATFERLFLTGAVRYLNAYPARPANPTARLWPVPRSLRQVKGREEAVDLAAGAEPASEGLEAIGRDAAFCTLTSGAVELAHTPLRLSTHIARGNPAVRDVTNLFAYEAITGGTPFVAVMLGSEADLTELLAFISAENGRFRVGRSMGAEYGGAPLFSMDDVAPEPFLPEGIQSEYDIESAREGIPAEEAAADSDMSGRLILTLTSPLFLADPATGDPSLEFPTQKFAQQLVAAGALDPATADRLTVRARFQAVERIGGFSALWGLPRPQWDAIAAGSVFVLDAPGLQLRAGNLAAAEWPSLGLRTSEGFGRFALGWHGVTARRARVDAQTGAPATPRGAPPAAVGSLASAIVRQFRSEMIGEQAARNAGAFTRPPSAAQVGRLMEIAQRLEAGPQPFAAAHTSLLAAGRLNHGPIEQWKSCWIRGSLDQSLLDHVVAVLNPAQGPTQDPDLAQDWTRRIGLQPNALDRVRQFGTAFSATEDPGQGWQERRAYLLAFASTLGRRVRT